MWFSTKQASTKGIWENEFMRFSEDLRFNEDWGTIWDKGSAEGKRGLRFEIRDSREGFSDERKGWGKGDHDGFAERGKSIQRCILLILFGGKLF